jgi:hypothetical protein
MGRRDKVYDGATADASADSNKILVIDHEVKLIYVKCNHATEDIQYQIEVYADSRDPTDSQHTLLTWRFLAAGDTAIHKTTDPWDKIWVSFKNNTPGSASSAVIWINSGTYRRG